MKESKGRERDRKVKKGETDRGKGGIKTVKEGRKKITYDLNMFIYKRTERERRREKENG